MKECSINGCDCRIKKIQNNLDKPRYMIHDCIQFHVFKKKFILGVGFILGLLNSFNN